MRTTSHASLRDRLQPPPPAAVAAIIFSIGIGHGCTNRGHLTFPTNHASSPLCESWGLRPGAWVKHDLIFSQKRVGSIAGSDFSKIMTEAMRILAHYFTERSQAPRYPIKIGDSRAYRFA
jgi:hypothetical protein